MPEIATGVERYSKFFERSRAFPENAFDENRFFQVRDGDTWYKSLSCFSDHYLALRAKWGTAKFVGDAVANLAPRLADVERQFNGARIIYLYRQPLPMFVGRSTGAAADGVSRRTDDETLLHSVVNRWNENVRALLDWVNRDSSGNVHSRLCVLRHDDFVSGSVDMACLSVFLELGEGRRRPVTVLPTEPTCQVGGDLSAVYGAWLWDMLDVRLLLEMQRLLESQRVYFLQKGSTSDRPGRREWYHSEDQRLAEITYGEFRIPKCNYVFRGRRQLSSASPYVACIGSATTFGRFLRDPYPAQLERATGKPFVNLGIGGARPESYLANEALLEFLSDAQCIIMETMSARGYASPLFEPLDEVSNFGFFKDFFGLANQIGQGGKLSWLVSKACNGQPIFVDRVFEITARYLSDGEKNAVRSSILSKYFRDVRCLMERVRRPFVVLYLSRNRIGQRSGSDEKGEYASWSGHYPHFIDEVFLSYARHLGATVVVPEASKGVPFVVRNWRTGEPAAVFPWQPDPSMNSYYPSQEMHNEATSALLTLPEVQC